MSTRIDAGNPGYGTTETDMGTRSLRNGLSERRQVNR
jgi:hypothetical protein